jgi:hypothetical protein
MARRFLNWQNNNISLLKEGFKMETYKIIRFKRDGDNEVIKEGLSLKEAQEHCQDDDTKGEGWFDGYEKEG